MMFLAIAIISILAITGLVWLLNRILPFKICPICAGVSGTWLWMIAAKFLGYEIDLVIPAMLMGGSVVGIAYQVEKRLSDNYSPLLWKTLFIPVGFVAVYGVISSRWLLFTVAASILILMVLIFMRRQNSSAVKNEEAIEELKKKMKNCC